MLMLLPQAQAVSPPPDGAYSNFTTAEGQNALQSLTSGAGNTALGAYSLFSTATASFNTAIGALALDLNTGDQNTAVGVAALLLNTGANNTAIGVDALGLNTAGGSNAAVGAFALYNNISGGQNSALGVLALDSNTTGSINTAIGVQALQTATTADRNTAIGAFALQDDTIGDRNTAVGTFALSANTEGAFNTAVGVQALNGNLTGILNTALGVSAGSNVMTASNVTCIGANASGADVSSTTWIANVFGTTTISGTTMPVIVSTAGQLGTMSSSRRFKNQIKPMDKASEVILALKPVTFHYNNDNTGTPQFGLIAEEVADVYPDLVVRDKDGKAYSVRYEAVNAMLLNEFLKEHAKVEQLKKGFESKVAEQQKQIEALTAGLQRVSAQLELSKAAPLTVKNTN
jgi:Chaperone of endosialidase